MAVHCLRLHRGGIDAVVVVALPPVPVGVCGLELALQLADGAVLVLALLLEQDQLPAEVGHLVQAARVLPRELQLIGKALQLRTGDFGSTLRKLGIVF